MNLKENAQNKFSRSAFSLLSLTIIILHLGACHSIKKSDSAPQQVQQQVEVVKIAQSSPGTVTQSIPNMEDVTIKGIVTAEGKGLEGVVVSDGYEVTITNADGEYFLASEKKNGYVFISVPGNYEVTTTKNLPQFFKRLGGGSVVEQKDFILTKTDNTQHVVLALADWHLANRNNDLEQFREDFLPDLNATIATYKAKGVKVYGLTLGDLAWDSYWYKNNFALPEYLKELNKVNCPIFNVIGNHDNDPYAEGDWDAALPFKNIVSPNYYSFNLGNIHYVVLDNVEYINTGASEGKAGKGNYNGVIVDAQMEWLKKDLATITDKNTPIVIAMHIPLFSFPRLDDEGEQTHKVRLENGDKLLSLLQDFEQVRLLTGHTHVNFTVEDTPSITEHNIAAVCATWWWTGKKGYAGNHICKDGSPGGYSVWENDGNKMEWYYKSMGYDKDYQFRVYDLNTIHMTAEKYAPKSTEQAFSKYTDVYGTPNSNNEVLINVWGYDNEWKIEVTENGEPLEVERVSIKDPLHIVSYEALRLNVGSNPTSSFVSNYTNHMFKTKASSATSTLLIKVTDRFGNVYTEAMNRPKAFGYSMR